MADPVADPAAESAPQLATDRAPGLAAEPTGGLEATTPWVRRWLRAEGIAALVGGFAGWLALGAPWPLFFALLLIPDVSMLGYLADRHTGAIAYNIGHNWAVGGLVLGLGLALNAPPVALAGVILVAHTGMDRMFGYGLKYPTSFQDTHLGRIGRKR